MLTLPLLGLALALFLLAISPGPGVFLTISRALNPGLPAALITVSGIVLGDILYVFAAVLGLSAIASVSPYLSLAIELPIGLYLIWHGANAWLSTNRPQTPSAGLKLSGWRYFSEGLLITLSNPKVIIFYGGFLPNFVNLATISWLDLSKIMFVVTLVIGGVLSGYAFFAARMQQYLANSLMLTWLNRLAAGAIFLAGCAILFNSLA